MVSQRPSTGRDLLIGIAISLAVSVAGIFYLQYNDDLGLVASITMVMAIHLAMGFAGALWWWRVRGSWSLLLIVVFDLIADKILKMLIAWNWRMSRGAVMLVPAIFLLMLIGAKLGYWTRDYINYRWGE